MILKMFEAFLGHYIINFFKVTYKQLWQQHDQHYTTVSLYALFYLLFWDIKNKDRLQNIVKVYGKNIFMILTWHGLVN